MVCHWSVTSVGSAANMCCANWMCVALSRSVIVYAAVILQLHHQSQAIHVSYLKHESSPKWQSAHPFANILMASAVASKSDHHHDGTCETDCDFNFSPGSSNALDIPHCACVGRDCQ